MYTIWSVTVNLPQKNLGLVFGLGPVAARGFLPPGANVCVAAPSSQIQGRIQQSKKRGPDGERAERESITGVWGRSPQQGPGAERSPPKLKHF